MQIHIQKIIWDEYNVDHIRKHNVTTTEVENSLRDVNTMFLASYEDRILALGKVGPRLLTTVLSHEQDNEYYVVTARDMSKKERQIYRNEQT